VSKTEEKKAARRKESQDRRAARRQALLDAEAKHLEELEALAEEHHKTRQRLVQFKCRNGDIISFDFRNSITVPFDPDKDSVDNLGPRVQEQIRLTKEAENSRPN